MPHRPDNLTFFLILSVLLMFSLASHATHQRAAEIQYRHVGGLTYEITLISYTFTPSPANAYRDYLTILWGDNTTSEIRRVEIINLAGDITYNRYVGEHTFPGPATYTISCEDPNRNGGILNIPNSINTPLFIFSELTINPFIGGYNNSPVLLIPPIDNGCVDQPFYHNPGAWDADGDSLSYRLVPCRGAQGQLIPGYTYPEASNQLTLNPITGDFLWDSPEQQGEYNIAILVEEWRNGVKIGSMLRDMQIIIVACDNRPPVIETVSDTCVEAGKTLRFPVKAIDPDSNKITLTATGGPFLLGENPATLEPDPATGWGTVDALFRWNTVCNHVKKQPYTVYFKAKDNGSPVNLVTIKSTGITVIGPAPENLLATPFGNTITLTWDAYTCPNATAFHIYRKADSTGFSPGYCETGVPAYLGYSKVGMLNGIDITTWLDDNNGAGLSRGLKYCYMVVAIFEDQAESYASAEACAMLNKDVPVITNVSIKTTSAANGSLYLAWSKPTKIDTVQAPGPYRYIIGRRTSDIQAPFTIIDSLDNLNDTIYNDTLLNTVLSGFTYRIDLYNITPGNRFLLGSSQPAASPFLTAAPTDRAMKLAWSNNVPWTNNRFVVYRRDPGGTNYDSVGQSLVPIYTDKGLINGLAYCYKIKAVGRYSAGGFVDPIINHSQELCAVPVDNQPPCPPELTIITDCETLVNRLSWRIPADSCPEDIAGYYIYFATPPALPSLLDSLNRPYDTLYVHKPEVTIVGCYYIVAYDSTGNRSDPGNIVCIDLDACPSAVYRLPNIFTPNGDGHNDLFIPFPYTSVERIDLTIIDRWGREVFTTSDPAIRWDGRDKTTGQPCSDGTYFYLCDIYEITLQGTFMRTLRGSLTLLR